MHPTSVKNLISAAPYGIYTFGYSVYSSLNEMFLSKLQFIFAVSVYNC